jgi:Zn-dependent peptidase ImmA (M78 family)
MRLPKKLLHYLDNAPIEIKKFILEKCEFIFGHIAYFNAVGYYVGEINNKHVIRFKSNNPRILTFFHEVGHAYSSHSPQKDNLIYARQEKEANDFAKKILNGSWQPS